MWVYCRGIALWDLMVEGKPEFNRNGTFKVVNGSVVRGEWYLSDLDVRSQSSPRRRAAHRSSHGATRDRARIASPLLQLVRALFTFYDHSMYTEAVWPEMADLRHGYPPGVRNLPEYEGIDDASFASQMWTRRGTPLTVEGFDPTSQYWDGTTPVWRALNLSYDQVRRGDRCVCGGGGGGI